MTETTVSTAPKSEAPTSGTTPGETPKTEVTTPQTPVSTESTVFDAEYVKGLRDEAASWRTKLRDTESQMSKLAETVAEFEKAKLTVEERNKLELEEAKTKAAKLAAENKAVKLESAVAKNLRTFELADVDAALRLLDQNSVEYDDSGNVTNIESVLSATLERYPFLKAASKPAEVVPPNVTASNPGKQRKGGLTREIVQSMSHDERTQRMPEIVAWMQNGYQ